MVWTNSEIIALLFSLVIIIKLVALTMRRERRAKIIEALGKKSSLISTLFFFLAAVILYYLTDEMSLAQILAGVAFGYLLVGASIMLYSNDLTPVLVKMIKRNLSLKTLITALIWALILIALFLSIFV